MKKMMMMVAALAACMATLSDGAQARRMSATAGMRVTDNCFKFTPNSPGLFNSCATPRQIVLPMMLESVGARALQFRGRRFSDTGMVQCQAFAYTTTGALASQSALRSITEINNWQGPTMMLDNVPEGSQGVVVCNLGGNSDGQLLGIEYPL